jgi:DNA-binding transcriptional regulator YdaS (Cro superfamily)
VDPERLTPFEAFDLAVTRVGGQSAMARICGCTPGNINQLLQAKRPMPAEYVLRAELASGVSRHLIRSDVYPRGLVDDEPFEPGTDVPGLDSFGPGDDLLIVHGWAAAARFRAERQANPSPEWPVAAAPDEGSGNSATKTQTAVMEEHAVGASVDEADDGRPADALHSAGAR